MNILGISAFYHDSAAAIISDGVIVAAAQEERFSRVKHDSAFPSKAAEYCLAETGLRADQLDLVAFYDKPLLKFDRLLETYLAVVPAGLASFIKAMPPWLSKKLWLGDLIKKNLGYNGKVIYAQHHQSHAASAFFCSPFERAAFLTLDGVGEWATTSWGVGQGSRVTIQADIRFPHSLGLMYSAFTYFCGFKVNSGEYKLMGLAPYGEPRYYDLIKKELIDLKPDGSFKLNMRYFNYCRGLTMTTRHFAKLFGGSARAPETELTQREMDLANSVQKVTEEAVTLIANHVHTVTGEKRLVLAGGVALNCVTNGMLLRQGPYQEIWIQPAAGDAGGALGAAMFAWHQYLENPRQYPPGRSVQGGSYWGPAFSQIQIYKTLEKWGAPYRELEQGELCRQVAGLLAEEKVVGWFQGRMEFGPRALGNRSIIGDARSPRMQEMMNLKIKYRESFRPFAPSVIFERVGDYFELDRESPYMLLVAGIRPELKRATTADQEARFGMAKLKVVRSEIPAVTHVDYSSRIHTVHPDTNPLYYQLIKEFERLTGWGVLINTSFNVRGEPIVCTPDDAYTCFMRTGMDYLVLGNCLLSKAEQPAWREDDDWRQRFELD